MRFKPKGNLTGAIIPLAFTFLTILVWPAITLAQLPQSTPVVTNPDDPSRAFGDTNKAVEAAAQGIPGSTEISAPARGAAHSSGEKVIKVDPAKERKEREKAYHDPTFDGSGLFADIKPPPSATPAVRVNPARNASSLSAGGTFLAAPRLSPIPSLSPSEHSSPAPVASPTASPAASPTETPAESPSPSPSASPQS